jgi:hypothetical protein
VRKSPGKNHLTAPVFDGKTFWQVEKDLIWFEEGTPIQIKEAQHHYSIKARGIMFNVIQIRMTERGLELK